jgi:hypothetical protein
MYTRELTILASASILQQSMEMDDPLTPVLHMEQELQTLSLIVAPHCSYIEAYVSHLLVRTTRLTVRQDDVAQYLRARFRCKSQASRAELPHSSSSYQAL